MFGGGHERTIHASVTYEPCSKGSRAAKPVFVKTIKMSAHQSQFSELHRGDGAATGNGRTGKMQGNATALSVPSASSSGLFGPATRSQLVELTQQRNDKFTARWTLTLNVNVNVGSKGNWRDNTQSPRILTQTY